MQDQAIKANWVAKLGKLDHMCLLTWDFFSCPAKTVFSFLIFMAYSM